MSDFVLKSKYHPKFVRDTNYGLRLLIFQLSNVRGLETIIYAYVAPWCNLIGFVESQ